MKRIVFWIILFTVMNCSTDKTPPPNRNARNAGSPPQRGKLFKCGQTNCPGLGVASDVECGMCGACLHSFCVSETNREIEALGAEVILGENLCSLSCYRYLKSDSLTADAVKAERSLLMKKNKEQQKKEAREFNIKVNNRVNGASRDLPKEVIIARTWRKKCMHCDHPWKYHETR
jgi:hypothetical protein